MRVQEIIYLFLALFAGIVVTFQGGINARLGMNLKSGDWATFLTFIIGTIILAIYLLLTRQTMPPVKLFTQTPIWTYLGALTGVIYVTLVIIITPKLGVGTTTIMLLFGQVITSVLIDHFDIFSLGARPIDLYRIFGIVLVLIGVVLINKKI